MQWGAPGVDERDGVLAERLQQKTNPATAHVSGLSGI